MGAVPRLRSGFTLHELLISLGVTAGICALASNLAVSQLRFFRGAGEMAAMRDQLVHVNAIPVSLLWGISPAAGDILVALDSALEFRAAIGSAVVCDGRPGWLTVPSYAPPSGNALGSYVDSPEPDDAIAAFFEDSLGAGWLELHVAMAPNAGGACPAFPVVAGTWTLQLREPVALPSGTVVRFLRPLRLSLYRASDNRWYLGARDWNGTLRRFNSIQPVAGPVSPYDEDPGKTGLLFTYVDASNLPVPGGSDPRQIAGVRITARGSTRKPASVVGRGAPQSAPPVDSLSTFVAFRSPR